MTRPTLPGLTTLLFLLLGLTSQISARPVDFNEISLLVRCREPETSIRDDVTMRKLMRPLTSDQEATLKKQGASDSLIQYLHNNNLVVSKEEAEALDASDRRRMAAAAEQMENHVASHRNVHIFNIAYGQPINLSEFGGADYEIAFFSYRSAGEDHIMPAMIDQVRTGTDVSRTLPLLSENDVFNSDFFPNNTVRNGRFTPYDASGDLRDNRFLFSDSVAVSSHEFVRPLHIDWDSPVFIEGQPYTFYRVYGGGGVALYYIGQATAQSAMVAVVSNL
jgi:hypothetical protein